MLNVIYWSICVCLLFQSIRGKSINFDASYQEIEDKPTILLTDEEENEQIREDEQMKEDQLSEGSLEDICKYFRQENIRKIYPNAKCQVFDDVREIKLVKRDVEEENDMLEGSGDSKLNSLTDDSLILPVEVDPGKITLVPDTESSNKNSTLKETGDTNSDSKLNSLTDDSLILPVEVDPGKITLVPDIESSNKNSTLKETGDTNSDADTNLTIPIKEEEPSEILSTKDKISESSIPAVIASPNTLQIVLTSDTVQSIENLTLLEINRPTSEINVVEDELNHVTQTEQNNSIKIDENPIKTLNSGGEVNYDPSINSTTDSTEKPLLFKNGFDEILKNVPRNQHNTSIEDGNNLMPLLKSGPKENDSLGASNNETLNTGEGGEISKAGASQEETSAASPNNILLLVFAALGIVGTLAFAFNYIKKRREDREINETMKLEEEGRELKEIKPLIKNPLTQNGAKSLEYIDAEPQKDFERQQVVETNHNLGNGQGSKSQI